MKTSKSLLAFLLLTLLGFIWGSGYSLAKYAMSYGVPPLGYAFWQSFGPALLLTFASFKSIKNYLFKPKFWKYFFVCGLVGIAIPNTIMYFIATQVPAGSLAVVVNTVPLLVYPMSLIAGQEPIDLWRILAIIMGMLGILFIISPQMPPLFSPWYLLALLCPLAFAFCSVYIAAKQPSELNALEAASGMLIAASLFLLPLVLQQHAFYPLSFPINKVEQVVILEIVLSSLGYFVFFKLIQLAGPVYYSLTGGVVALTGLFWAYIFFAEKPSPKEGLAIVFVLSAIFLLSWRQSQLRESNDAKRCHSSAI